MKLHMTQDWISKVSKDKDIEEPSSFTGPPMSMEDVRAISDAYDERWEEVQKINAWTKQYLEENGDKPGPISVHMPEEYRQILQEIHKRSLELSKIYKAEKESKDK